MNDYKIIVEKKYYAVFIDGQGQEQKVEVTKEVAEAIQSEQRSENALRRLNERHTISMDSLDYEGDVFATYDSYEIETEEEAEEMTRQEKAQFVLAQMKPKYAELLRMSYFQNMTHEQIAEIKGVSRPAITQQMRTAERIFKKIFENPI